MTGYIHCERRLMYLDGVRPQSRKLKLKVVSKGYRWAALETGAPNRVVPSGIDDDGILGPDC